MGLFGGGNSKNTTTNNDNRVVNDYANASWDNSVNNEYLQETNGDLNNNSGTITMLDPNAINGALDIVSGANQLAGDAIESNTLLADSAMAHMKGVNSDSLTFADGALNTAIGSMENVSGYSIDAAMNFADNATLQQQMNSDLTLALAGNARAQSSETNQALTDGFEQMMQFTEQFSRSDGAALAETNSKTVGFMVAGVLGALFLFRWGKK